MGFLDFFFPKTCVGCGFLGAYLCKNCQGQVQYLQEQFCPECGHASIGGATHPKCQKKLGLDGLVAAAYFSFPVNKVVHALKYQLTTDLLGELEQKLVFPQASFLEDSLLLPVPLHWQRKNFRGFNQSELLGKVFAQKFKLALDPSVLKRIVKTKPQVSLKRGERLSNVQGVFEVMKNVTGANIVVFDDVWTTGSTLKNVCFSLKKAGASKVWGLTLARSR